MRKSAKTSAPDTKTARFSLVKFQPRAKAPKKDFQHPACCPSADDMLYELSEAGRKEGFEDAHGWDANWEAKYIETKLYNKWVELQCALFGLRSPGELDCEQFADRFWD